MAEEQQQKKSYKDTLNPRQTGFSMKANLVQREPAIQKRWEKIGLDARIAGGQHPAGPFVFHDGPPYANGDIHLGHLLNKVLKDIVVRSRTMMGHFVDYVPGWDCHGLPIEHKVLKELGPKAKEMDAIAVRRKCKNYAEKYVKTQMKQMQRLGTHARYDDPYITMDPSYEAQTLEVFSDLVSEGLVFRMKKPVHWSIDNQTALAEAELEYHDREDTSVYVDFVAADRKAVYDAFGLPEEELETEDEGLYEGEGRPGQTPSLMIWTTTPWTLPANLAIAVAPHLDYALVLINGNFTILAAGLVGHVAKLGGCDDPKVIATIPGEKLIGLSYHHPFIDRTGPVVAADYVTLSDEKGNYVGTGLVHTAPGHGAEDYATGLKEDLEIYCPVRGDGTFDETAPDWLQSKSVWEANPLVVEHLRESGHLFHDNQFLHSYPHDWRSKGPVIFRATEQWFIGMEREMSEKGGTLRGRALDETAADVQFIPEAGRNRMRGMLENAPDWCISRQRAWGLPIPAFMHSDGERYLLTATSVKAVADVVRQRGSDVWFFAESAELLANYDPATDPDAPDWLKENPAAKNDLVKGSDIFDVWFESGSSWSAVLEQRGLGFPADLYLEGSDQHRGWFQKSLLPAIGARGQSPFKAVLTHGFMVDADGRKMSKSGGNAVSVEELMTKHGADVARWWVGGLAYANDVKVDWKFFDEAGEEYRKVRNTIRFCLMNLADFDPEKNGVAISEIEPTSIDAWVLGELDRLIEKVEQAYQAYQFRTVHEDIFNFCNDTLSAVYLVATKDRLYCDAADSPARRRTQTAIQTIASALIRLIAPILVHTADEAWLALHGENIEQTGSDATVHTQHFPKPLSVPAHPGWGQAMKLRDAVLAELENAKMHRGLKNPLDAGVVAGVPSEMYQAVEPLRDELPDLCGVSRFELTENGPTTIDVEDLTAEPRCERSWKRDTTVRERSDGSVLSDRDAAVVGVA